MTSRLLSDKVAVPDLFPISPIDFSIDVDVEIGMMNGVFSTVNLRMVSADLPEVLRIGKRL